MSHGISQFPLARVREAASGFIRGAVVNVCVVCLVVFANGFEVARVPASPYESQSKAAQQNDVREQKVVLLLLAEVSGVTSLYRYHYGVEPATGIELRDEQRMQEGFRGVLTLVLITVVAPVGLAIFFRRRRSAVGHN